MVDVILAIVLYLAAEYAYQPMYGVIGIAFLIVGPVLSWINSLLLYAFGEITVSLVNMSKGTRENNTKKDINEEKFRMSKKWKTMGVMSDEWRFF